MYGPFFLSFGALLILIAIVGGRMEVKEIKILGAVGAGGRAVAGVLGGLFLLIGLGTYYQGTQETHSQVEAATPQSTRPASPAVPASVNDDLSGLPTQTASRVIRQNASSESAPPATVPVEFTVYDQLRPEEIAGGESYQMAVKINGTYVGNLAANPYASNPSLGVRVASTGAQTYNLNGELYVQGMTLTCSGAGTIFAKSGDRFQLIGTVEPDGRCVGALQLVSEN